MKRAFLLPILLLGAAFIASAEFAHGQTPETLSYQGVLALANGDPVPNGTYKLTFRLSSNPTGPDVLWEEVHENVPVQNGLFEVILGTITPMDAPFDELYYLSISVEDDPELAPRIPLTSSAYSFRAHSVEPGGVTGASIAEGAVVKSLNGLTDDVQLTAGENVTITPQGDALMITASGGAGGVTLPFSGTASTDQAAFAVDNTGTGDGIGVSSAAADGLVVTGAGKDGVDVVSAGEDGVRVQGAGGYGVRATGDRGAAFFEGKVELASPDFEDHLVLTRPGTGSMHVTATNPRGLAVSDGDGNTYLLVDQASGNVGIGTNSPTAALSVNAAGEDGVDVVSAGDSGVRVTSAGADGLLVLSAGNPSTSIDGPGNNGVEVRGAEDYGLYVGRADQTGVFVNDAGDNGVFVLAAGGAGVEVVSAGEDGVRVQDAGGYGVHATGDQGAAFFEGKVELASPNFEDHLVLNRTGAGSMHVTATNPRGLAVSDGDGNTYLLVDQASGNVGIGTTSPTAALDVNGEVKWASKSSYATVHHMMFDAPNPTDDGWNRDIGLSNDKGVRYEPPLLPGLGTSLYAQISLPHGATLQELTMYFKDNSPLKTARLRLFRSELISDTIEELGEIDTELISRSKSVALNHTVDNENNIYFLRVRIPDDNNVWFKAAQIRYEVTGPY